MVINDNTFYSKKLQKFICEKCDFKCSNKQDYHRHLSTLKHKMVINGNNKPPYTSTQIVCSCGKKYKHTSGLSRHKRSCFIAQGENITNSIVNSTTYSIDNDDTDNISNTNNSDSRTGKIEIDREMLIKMLLKNQDVMENVILKNQEVMEKMMEIMPNMGNNNITNSHNTTNNNQFNIQMFLNNHCKNAMNLTDFIDSLPITAETYDSNIDNGLTKTIANMFTAGLSQLDILERPIHCTDASRKTLYVKEGDVWEKDNALVKMIQGIRQMAAKQRILINKWRDAHDDWNVNDRMQERFTTLVCNMVEDIENQEKETNKIIRSVSKEVYLNSDTKSKYLE